MVDSDKFSISNVSIAKESSANIKVRLESIPIPEGKTEKRELRSKNSKTFIHQEKLDGKELHTCEVRMGAVCYESDDGELRSIDTTIQDKDGVKFVEWAPYKFYLHETGIGFDFYSREGGFVKITLVGIGGEEFNSKEILTPTIKDNIITFEEVKPGCDIIFKCLNQRVKTLRILHDEKAPRTFEWFCESDEPELVDSTLTGTDVTGNQLELVSEVAGDVIRETWGGNAMSPFVGDAASVAYPVEIDPTVTVNPTASADDGRENITFGSWASGDSTVFFGSAAGGSFKYNVGVRFPAVNVANGVTVTSATLGLYVSGTNGTGGSGTIYGRAVDDAGQFGSGSDLPSAVAKTTASAALAADATTGAKTWTVTSIAQEIFNRGGWVSGGGVAIPIITDSTGDNYLSFVMYDNGSNIPSLSITYTAASSSIGPILKNRILLGRIFGGSVLN